MRGHKQQKNKSEHQIEDRISAGANKQQKNKMKYSRCSVLLLSLFCGVNNVFTAAYPKHLSFNEYQSILSFAGDDDIQLLSELGSDALSTHWEGILSDGGWNTKTKYKERVKKTTTENTDASLSPFIICHIDESDMCGLERHDAVDSFLSKWNGGNQESSGYVLDPIPIYNNNIADKKKSEGKEDEEFHGTCFMSSLDSTRAKQVNEENLLITPVAPLLKIRKQFFHTTEDVDSIDDTTESLAVVMAPGIFSSGAEDALEFAKHLQNLQGMDKDSSFLSDCETNVPREAKVTVGSISMSMHFFFTFRSELSYRCHKLFIEYVAGYPQVLSVEKVAKNTVLNYEARFIIESANTETRPWYNILTGEGQVVQVSDTGVDENHCYLKDGSGTKVMRTTDFDLTPLVKKIDTSKRKVIQYVSLDNIGDDTDSSGHGTHIVATIVGERSNDHNNGKEALANGIAPKATACFFDGNNKQTGTTSQLNVVTVPEDISQMFYFGREAGARITSASWGSGSSGEYTIKSQKIDEYFYNDYDDGFAMFAAAGNDGEEQGLNENRVGYPCTSKNMLCVGASHNGNIGSGDVQQDINVVASFSSHGPTNDNRIKPDIVAPGHALLSAMANSNLCDPVDGKRPPFDPGHREHDGLVYKLGTSMACPVAAGSGALIRQYFLDGRYPTGFKVEENLMDISGTLLKAVLINGADELSKRSKATYGGGGYDSSDYYDKFQGYGRLDLLKSLKHPDTTLHESPNLYVENERVFGKGETHQYEFSVCDERDFRVTLVWRDPPNTSGCNSKCLINDLDLEVNYRGEEYFPNGLNGKDSQNNVERVILPKTKFANSNGNIVNVKVKNSNLGYGNSQKYSLASTGCFNSTEVEFNGPEPNPTCNGPDEFEYTVEIFTNRKPEETSWVLQKQGSRGIEAAVAAGEYRENIDRLRSFHKKGCSTFGCFIFLIKDTAFDGICCEKGMGSYTIKAGDKTLLQGNSFSGRQVIKKFCHYESFEEEDEEPTPSPTANCMEDEFMYRMDIETDLYPDETRWELRNARIDSVDEGTYRKPLTQYEHEGCLDLGGCYSFTIYGEWGEYSIMADDFVITDRKYFEYHGDVKEFCYSGESNTETQEGKIMSSTKKMMNQVLQIDNNPDHPMSLEILADDSLVVRTKLIGDYIGAGSQFDDQHEPWLYGKIVKIELYFLGTDQFLVYITITYANGQSFSHGNKNWSTYSTRYVITLGEDQHIVRVTGRYIPPYSISQLKFYTNDDTLIFGPYGCAHCNSISFDFDFGGNVLLYMFGRADPDLWILQLGFAHIPLSSTPNPTVSEHPSISFQPSRNPSTMPSYLPSGKPSILQSNTPSISTQPSESPSISHIPSISIQPSENPTISHIPSISIQPSENPSILPSNSPSLSIQPSESLSYGIRTSEVGDNFGYKFDDKHPRWKYGRIVQIELYTTYYHVSYIGITYQNGMSFNHGEKASWMARHIITLGEDQYITRVSGRATDDIRRLKFEANDGQVFGPYGSYKGYYGESFEFDFGGNALLYIFGKVYGRIKRIGFAHASLSETTPGPTPQPTSHHCGDGQFRYRISIRTDHLPDRTWWELYPKDHIIDSVPYMTYKKQLQSYSHTGCAKINNCYELRTFDKRRDGLCCYFGSGSYKLSAGNTVLAQGNNFDDATMVGNILMNTLFNPDDVFNRHEFCHNPSHPSASSIMQPTSNPTTKRCDEDQFEYRIRVRTDHYPAKTSWEFKYSTGYEIGSYSEYFLENYEHNHRGCILLDECYSFTIYNPGGLCCRYGNGGYSIFADDVVMIEGAEFNGGVETKTFCYGPSFSSNPSLQATVQPSTEPSTSLNPSSQRSNQPSLQPTATSQPSTSLKPTLVTCSDDEFRYEIAIINDSSGEGYVSLYYKYPDQGVSFYSKKIPPNSERKVYGCAKYSCFEIRVESSYLKLYNADMDTLIAQNTETYEKLRFCYDAPEPTPSPTISLLPSTSPITSPEVTLIALTLSFSDASLEAVDVSEVVQTSVYNILNQAISRKIEPASFDNIIVDVVAYFCEEDLTCQVVLQICEGSCDVSVEDDFMAFIENTMNEAMMSGELLQTLKDTAEELGVSGFDTLTDSDIQIYIGDDYISKAPTLTPTSIPTEAPSQANSKPTFLQQILQNPISYIIGAATIIIIILVGIWWAVVISFTSIFIALIWFFYLRFSPGLNEAM